MPSIGRSATARATTSFFLSLFSIFKSCISGTPKPDEDSSAVRQMSHLNTVEGSITSSECEHVAISEDSFVMELVSHVNTFDDPRPSLIEAIHYEPTPTSIRSVSSESLQITEEIDIADIPLTIDEIRIIRRSRQTKGLAERLRAERKEKRRFFRRAAKCFGLKSSQSNY